MKAGARLAAAVTILTASIIYLTLMILVFKVAGNLTKGWKLGRFTAAGPASHATVPAVAHQERAFTPSTVPATNASIASDRVRSTVASIEAAATSSRLPAPAMARIAALPASAPVPALAGPSDARGQMRYLHHRVAGATNNVSREIFR